MMAWRADLGDLRASCVRFGRLLRDSGLPVAQDRVTRWLRSLELLACSHPADLYWSGRVNLVASPAHLARYDELFRQFWLILDQPALAGLPGPPERVPSGAHLSRRAGHGDSGGGAADVNRERPGEGGTGRWQVGMEYRPPGTPAPPSPAEADDASAPGLYSAIEVLREKDFAAYQGEDETQLLQLLSQWPDWLLPHTRSRRLRPALRGGLIDLRRSVADAVRHGGDPTRLYQRAQRVRWRKWVFLCDISASMAPYSRAFLRFLAAVAGRRRSTEVFLFGTRLTRVTPQLRRPAGPDLHLEAVPDWHGGTRLGEALERFLRQYGQRGMAHGAVLFILSDGLDVGAPGQVAAAMAGLDRIARRIVWVNPLQRTAGYQPLARAMAEALPYVDEFVSGHNYAGLVELLQRQAES